MSMFSASLTGVLQLQSVHTWLVLLRIMERHSVSCQFSHIHKPMLLSNQMRFKTLSLLPFTFVLRGVMDSVSATKRGSPNQE